MRFPPKAVIGCMALKFIGHSSYLAILTLLSFFCGVHVGSTGTLWDWVRKCERAFEMVHHTYRKSYGRKAWRIDEIFCRLKGNTSKKNCAYVYVVSDNKDNILAMPRLRNLDHAVPDDVETVSLIARTKENGSGR